MTTVSKDFNTFDMFDTDLKAVQETLTADEDFSLYHDARKNRSNHYAMCGSCEAACPNGLSIVDRLNEASGFFRTLSA